MSIKIYTLLSVFIFFSEAVYATVGGPQFLQFLGYKENNLYFIYEYHDEMVNAPELWRYEISADSLYVTKDWLDYPDESVNEALKRHDLEGLQIPDRVAAKNQLRFEFGEPVQRYMESMEMFYDLYPVNVKWGEEAYKLLQCYNKIDQPEINRTYSFPDLGISLAIIRYKGICFETGYLKDTLLIKSFQGDVNAEAKPVAEERDDKDQLPFIIALVTLSTVLMIINLFKKIVIK